MNKEEADKQIEEHVKKAYAELVAAETLADKFGLTFSFCVREYGISGYYQPKNRFSITKEEALKLVASGEISEYEVGSHEHDCIIEALKKPSMTDTADWKSSDCYGNGGGWRSSSDDC